MVGFFPAPYPNECLYSILCRYYARSGSAGYESVSKVLFGSVQSLALSVYLPIRLECIDNWLPQSSGITQHDIVIKHTLYPYWAVRYPSFHAEMDELINSGKISKDIQRLGTSRIKGSWVKYLKYCPLCVAEDIDKYGETYWRRQHQLSETFYCVKHETRLVDSSVLFKKTSIGFYPATNEVNVRCEVNNFDNLAPHKEKLLKIGRECEWLINNGADIDWLSNGYEKYRRLLRDKGLASVRGYCRNYAAVDAAFYDYWGKDFIDALFEATESAGFTGWFRKIEKVNTQNFTPLKHILLMCFLAGSVESFVNANPAETPFGHPPFACENRICPHYQIDGAEMIEMRHYCANLTAYFECSYCGMIYKLNKSSISREMRFIVDYGHLWGAELLRCCNDPEITNAQAMEILKCGPQTLSSQKRKRGLSKPRLYDVNMGPETYYKTKVLEICQEYNEVTIPLLDKKIPGAYRYLQDHDYEWIRSRVVFRNERRSRLEREDLLLGKLREIIDIFEVEGYPDQQLSYGFIASLIGAERDELRNEMSPNSELRAFLDKIIEHRKTWRQERAAKMRTTNISQVRAPMISQPLSKRESLLLSKLREVIATFEVEGYPDKQLSYDLLASLVGSTRDELRSKKGVDTELQAFLDGIVEHRGVWRQERAAKVGTFRSKRIDILQSITEQILATPPQQQISRKYIARISGISRDVIEDNPYLSEILDGIVESKVDWLKRRFTTAYHSKPIEGRPYSTLEICRAAAIDWITYDRRRELFEELMDALNHETE